MHINKKIFYILISLIFISFCSKNYLNAKLNLKGYIQVNSNWKSTPTFRILFNGKQTISDEFGFYSFPLDQYINKYSVLICKHIQKKFDKKNTLKNLKVRVDKPYKIYSFKKSADGKKWIQKEKNLKKKNFIIPENCIIVLINPKYIEKVEVWSVNPGANFIKLPKIKLKDNLNEARVKRESNKSLLRSLDLLPFHEKIALEKKKFDNDPKKQVLLVQ